VFKDGVPINQGSSRSGAVAMAEDLAFESEEAGEDVDLVIQLHRRASRTTFRRR
jgi:hypothetical protein